MKSFLKKLIKVNLILLFSILSTQLVAYPYAYQRLYRPEDGRCIDLIYDCHTRHEKSGSEEKFLTSIEKLTTNSENQIDVFIEGYSPEDVIKPYNEQLLDKKSTEKLEDLRTKVLKNSEQIEKILLSKIKTNELGEGEIINFRSKQNKILNDLEKLELECTKERNRIENEKKDYVENGWNRFLFHLPLLLINKQLNKLNIKTIEPRTREDGQLLHISPLLKDPNKLPSKTIGQLTEHIKNIIENKIDPFKEYELDQEAKPFIAEKWDVIYRNLKTFYDSYVLGNEDMNLADFFSDPQPSFIVDYLYSFGAPILDFEILLNLFSSPNQHSIVYAGGQHCENVSKDVEQLGFEIIVDKKSSIVNTVITTYKNCKYKPKDIYEENKNILLCTDIIFPLYFGVGELPKTTWSSLLEDPSEQYAAISNSSNSVFSFVKNHPYLTTAGTAATVALGYLGAKKISKDK